MSGRRSRNKGARVERGIVRASVSGIGSRRKGKIGKKIMQKLTSIKAIVPYLIFLSNLSAPRYGAPSTGNNSANAGAQEIRPRGDLAGDSRKAAT